ncbi:tyrosine-type recombinase/integrase [Vibrio splendidus]
MTDITYKIESTGIKNFTYKKPLVVRDENSKMQVVYSKDKSAYVHIKHIIFLNLVGRDKKSNIISYQPMDHVNEYILFRHIEDGIEDSAQDSKALIHYFSFILDVQAVWDKKYNNDDYDELLHPPRPEWNKFGIRTNHRATYMYHASLKKEGQSGSGLSQSICTAYMRRVVKFYNHFLRKGIRFNNPPFKHESFIISLHSDGTNMNSRYSLSVQSSDLKLTFAKPLKNDGGSIPNSRRELKPLANRSWQEVENILTKTKRVLKLVKGQEKMTKLSEEYCLFFILLRFTGLRKEEGASLHIGQITCPDMKKPMLRLGVGDEYGSLTKGVAGVNKNRRTIIPSSVMLALYNYTKSERYERRLKKFKELCQKKRKEGDDAFFDSKDGVDENKAYLFLSATGKPFFLKLTEINTRWGEIRKTASINLAQSIEDAVVHNLRSTFAVALFRMLLKKKDAEQALAIVSECLGHEDLETTLLYLQIAEDHPTGDEVWEDILDYLDVFKGLEDELLGDAIQPQTFAH